MKEPKVSLADALFPRTKQKVLGILFGQPDRSFYANELIKLADSGSGAVQRELALLEASALVNVARIGNQKHYKANRDTPLFNELCAIVQKTVGLAEPLRQALAPVSDRIRAAFVYGSVAKKSDTALSDIDLMIISEDIDYATVFSALELASAKLERAVNPTILTVDEIKLRLGRHDAFIMRVLAQPKIWIIGTDDDIDL